MKLNEPRNIYREDAKKSKNLLIVRVRQTHSQHKATKKEKMSHNLIFFSKTILLFRSLCLRVFVLDVFLAVLNSYKILLFGIKHSLKAF